ncbi:MAG: long-chain fatty acid--CoA ligase [Candidatus Hydrogenedentes bacterium]|nr:long-chain fatty acid--CoA ligase [Candidatus Hydrogenedentota bacterium]
MYNLVAILEDSAREYPDKDAVVFDSIRLTYQQIDALSAQVANALVAKGIRKGDKVAFTCPNVPYFPIVWMGVLKVGAVLVPLSVLLRPREIAYHLSDSESSLYICFEGTEEMPMGQSGYAGFQETPTCKEFIIIPTIPGGDSPIEGIQTLTEMTHEQPMAFETVQCRPDDTCLIIYTSGTTGRPKGAELSHSNMLMNCTVAGQLFEYEPDDKSLAVLPLFHSFGISVTNSTFLNGGTLVLMPRFETQAVLHKIQEEGITIFAGVPTMYWELLNYQGDDVDYDLIKSKLRLCISGGASLPVEVLKGFEEKYDVKILEGYGLSETSPTATFNRPDRERKIGSIGQAIWGVQVKVVDPDMNEVPVGKEGEIVIRGHNVMKGYYKRDEANEEAFRGGWFHSGDIGKMDEDRYFYIVDRMKDMIIRGGFNVYPREIEEVMMTHEDVSLVAVIGVPSEQHGEEIKAFVVPKTGVKPDIDALRAWCKDQMAAYKYPRIIEVVDSLPLGPTGKILKLELRAMDEAKRKEEVPAK